MFASNPLLFSFAFLITTNNYRSAVNLILRSHRLDKTLIPEDKRVCVHRGRIRLSNQISHLPNVSKNSTSDI